MDANRKAALSSSLAPHALSAAPAAGFSGLARKAVHSPGWMLFLCAWAFVCAPARAADTAPPKDAHDFASGGSPLDEFYQWEQSRPSQPPREWPKLIESLHRHRMFFEEFMWSSAIAKLDSSAQSRLKPAKERLNSVLAASLEREERRLGMKESRQGLSQRAEAAAARRRSMKEVEITTDTLDVLDLCAMDAVEHLNPSKASELLFEQFQLNPSHARFLRWRAFMLLDGGRRRETALLRWEEAATTGPLAFPEALDDLAVDRLRRRQDAEALPFLFALQKRAPERLARHSSSMRRAIKARLAQLCESEQFDDAVRLIEEASLMPGAAFDLDMSNYALYYKLQRDQEKIPNGGRQALMKFLLNHSIFSEGSSIGQALRDPNLPLSTPNTFRAIAEIQMGNAGVAYQLLQKAVQEEPPTPAFYFALGLAAERFKNVMSPADKCYLQALEIDPAYEPALLALARQEFLRGRFEEAQERLSIVLAAHPENVPAKYESARIAYVQSDLPRAAALLESLAKSDRAKPDHYLFLAQIAVRSKDFPRAEAWLRALLAAFPDEPRGHYQLAEVYRLQNKPDAESAELEEVLDRTRFWRFERPDSARLFLAAARKLRERGANHDCAFKFNLNTILPPGARMGNPSLERQTQSQSVWRPPLGVLDQTKRLENLSPWTLLDMQIPEAGAPQSMLVLAKQPPLKTLACDNILEIQNNSNFDAQHLVVFADDTEVGFCTRVIPKTSVILRYRSSSPPRKIGLLYITELGAVQNLAPAGEFARNP